jgi:hypothetical protein
MPDPGTDGLLAPTAGTKARKGGKNGTQNVNETYLTNILGGKGGKRHVEC